jgi:hypothetical protein
MKNHLWKIALALAVLFTGAAFAQDVPKTETLNYFKDLPQAGSLDTQADQGVGMFQRRANQGNGKAFSLNSASEAYGVQKGQPIAHYFVRLDKLAAYQAGQDPYSLLGKISSVTYPIVSGSDIKGAVNLGWNGSEWKVVSVGGAAFIQKWDSLRRGQLAKNGKNLDDFFAVRVPALDEDFVGYEDGGTLFLVPGRNNVVLGFHAGDALPAGEVFQKLATVAQNYHEKAFFKH